MKRLEINKGDRYNMLTIIRELEIVTKQRRFIVKCDCGNIKEVYLNHLRNSKIKSCGCHRQKQFKKLITKHNLRNHILYPTYNMMKQRCYNSNNKDYKDYGGRGIKVCDRWLESFEHFLEDMGRRPEGCSIDRIDVNGNYEPNNCRWATPSQQVQNQRRNCQTKKNKNQLTLTLD